MSNYLKGVRPDRARLKKLGGHVGRLRELLKVALCLLPCEKPVPLWYRVPVLGWFLCVRNHGLYQQSALPHSDGSYWCSWCRRER